MNTNRKVDHPAWSALLQCHYFGWKALSDDQILLYMPTHNVCDMSGCIEVAQKIMPDVRRIFTESGGLPDTEYRLAEGKWQAYDHRILRRKQ